jgi:hypothetical protein
MGGYSVPKFGLKVTGGDKRMNSIKLQACQSLKINRSSLKFVGVFSVNSNIFCCADVRILIKST